MYYKSQIKKSIENKTKKILKSYIKKIVGITVAGGDGGTSVVGHPPCRKKKLDVVGSTPGNINGRLTGRSERSER